jgi:TolB protein
MGDGPAPGSRARIRFVGPLAVVVGLVASFLPLNEALAADPSDGLITFTSFQTGSPQLFVAAPDGSGLRQITHVGPDVFVFVPAWSPDSGTIAYTRVSPSGRATIRLVGADGSGDHRLFKESTFDDFAPAFSPDGSTIAFDRCRPPGGPCTIYTIEANGKHLTQLLPFSTDGADVDPKYSPDGSKILFSKQYQRGGLAAIFVMNSDGTGLHRLTAWRLEAFNPTWTRDGSRIAFSTHCCTGGKIRILSAKPDGSDQVMVTHPNGLKDFGPAYSPSGDRIAFERDLPDFSDSSIWIVDADGSNPHEVFASAITPAWSPGGVA